MEGCTSACIVMQCSPLHFTDSWPLYEQGWVSCVTPSLLHQRIAKNTAIESAEEVGKKCATSWKE